ncbi:MAG: flagellar motor protein MotB, partial [Saprospiraceae bacterium]|nr:flagellar motor protein MotB [Saprospiraceae bacterium]
IDPTRLNYEGKGETELLNDCNDGMMCSMAQHQENERIELMIVQ